MSSEILTPETQQVNPSTHHQRNGTQQSVDPTNGNPSKSAILQPVWDAIPSELKAETRWILWQARSKPNSDKLDKVPIDKQGYKVNANDSTHWLSLEQAQSLYEQGKTSGVGFVLGDSYAGIDIDDCIDKSGNITPEAQDIITRLNSYTEISPSGRGVKIFLKGKKLGSKCRKDNVEIYDHGRFFTMTGHHVDRTPNAVLPRQAELDTLYRSVFGDTPKPKANKNDNHTGRITLDDAKLLQKAESAKNGEKFRRLWSSDANDYPKKDGTPDLSAADLALCNELAFWTGRDRERMNRLFCQSGLYREKWNEIHNENGQTYGEMTIDKAIADCEITYDPNYRSNGNESHKDAEAKTNKPTPEIEFTEGWLSRLFVQQHRQNLRYCPAWKGWLIWDGKRWKLTDTENALRLANETIRSLYSEAAEMEDSIDRKERAKFATKSDNQRRCKAIVEMASWELTITPDQFDCDPYLLNTPSGTVDLRTGELREHRRKDFITKITIAEYDPDAKLPLLDQFLERILPDPELRAFVQRALGYSALGHAKEEKLFFPFGPTATGKSTLLRAVQEALGDYAATADFETLLAQATDRNGRPKTELARLHGKRFVVSVEVDHGVKLAEGLVKWITGQDTVVARFLYGKEFEFLPSFSLWIAANHRPRVSDEDDAVWRRILQMPFDKQIPEGERDPAVKETLCDSSNAGAAVLAWVIKGSLEYQKRGLGVPDAVKKTTAEYRQEMNPLGDFITECCVTIDGAITTSEMVWNAYEQWANDNGIKYPLKRKAFGQRLEAMGFRSSRETVNRKQQRVFLGVGLLSEEGLDTLDTLDTTFDNFSKENGSYKKFPDHVSNASNASKPSNQADSFSLPLRGYLSDLESDPFIEEWYTNHPLPSYIKPSTAQSIAFSCGVDILHNLDKFAERKFLMSDGVIVQVMYTHSGKELEGLYLDAIYQPSNGNGHGKPSEIETEIPF